MLFMSLGWIALDLEEDTERLWAVRKTRALKDRDFIEDLFGDDEAISEVYLDRGSKHTNVLTKSALFEAFDVHDLVQRIDISSGKFGYDSRLCAPTYWSPDIRCQKESVLALWDYNRTRLELDPDPLETVRVGGPDCCSLVSRVVDVPAVVSKMDFDNSGTLVGAGALRMSFSLTQDRHRQCRNLVRLALLCFVLFCFVLLLVPFFLFLEPSCPYFGTGHRKVRIDPKVRRLETKFDRKLRRQNWVHFDRALPLTRTGYIENVIAAYDYDRLFVLISLIIIVTYAYWTLHNFQTPKKSRSLLALGAVLTAILSTAGAFGIGIASGLTFSWSTTIAIFLVIAIALDDSFVLMAEVDITTRNNGISHGTKQCPNQVLAGLRFRYSSVVLFVKRQKLFCQKKKSLLLFLFRRSTCTGIDRLMSAQARTRSKSTPGQSSKRGIPLTTLRRSGFKRPSNGPHHQLWSRPLPTRQPSRRRA